MHQSQTLQSQSPHTSQNNPSGSLTLSLKVCWKDHALTQVSLRVSSNTSLKSQSQVSLIKVTLKYLSKVYLPKWSLTSISQVISQSTSQEHISQTNDWLQQRNYCSDSSKEHVSQKLPKHWFKALQIDTKHLSKFGRSFISDYNLAVEVWSKFRRNFDP